MNNELKRRWIAVSKILYRLLRPTSDQLNGNTTPTWKTAGEAYLTMFNCFMYGFFKRCNKRVKRVDSYPPSWSLVTSSKSWEFCLKERKNLAYKKIFNFALEKRRQDGHDAGQLRRYAESPACFMPLREPFPDIQHMIQHINVSVRSVCLRHCQPPSVSRTTVAKRRVGRPGQEGGSHRTRIGRGSGKANMEWRSEGVV